MRRRERRTNQDSFVCPLLRRREYRSWRLDPRNLTTELVGNLIHKCHTLYEIPELRMRILDFGIRVSLTRQFPNHSPHSHSQSSPILKSTFTSSDHFNFSTQLSISSSQCLLIPKPQLPPSFPLSKFKKNKGTYE